MHGLVSSILNLSWHVHGQSLVASLLRSNLSSPVLFGSPLDFSILPLTCWQGHGKIFASEKILANWPVCLSLGEPRACKFVELTIQEKSASCWRV